jgi:uncharacterized RDD family membrane protein YckC
MYSPHLGLFLGLILALLSCPALSAQEPSQEPVLQSAPNSQPDSDPSPPVVTTYRSSRDIIRTGVDVLIAAGEEANNIQVFGADLIVEGDVTGDIEVIGGRARIRGRVDGDVFNVGKGVWVENGGLVEGDVVGFGAGVFREDGSTIRGQVGNYGIALLPHQVRDQAVLFFKECVVLGRPLSFRVGFVWVVWLVMLLLHALLAVIFPGATEATIRAMRERPGGTALLGILGLPLAVFALTLITFTAVGILVIPFLLVAGVLGLAIGRIALLRVIGGRFLHILGVQPNIPAAEFAIGAVVATALFTIPYVGIFTWMVFFLWALGGVLMALFRRSPRPVQASLSSPVADLTQPTPTLSIPTPSHAPTDPTVPTFPSPETPPLEPSPQPAPPSFQTPSIEEVFGAPRPGMGRRFAALAIDWLPILVVVGLFPDRIGFIYVDDLSFYLRLALGVTYYTWMISRKGTTLGGMILGMRVVRLDGRPMDRNVALVRALTAILSLFSLGLGWLWAVWDERRQTWHDRLAGTVLIRDDRQDPLI